MSVGHINFLKIKNPSKSRFITDAIYFLLYFLSSGPTCIKIYI